jgi:hypothetical protein
MIGGCERSGMGAPLNVVPAKAGTHNHRRLLEQKPSATVQKMRGRGVWVPAFAGTTQSVRIRPR